MPKGLGIVNLTELLPRAGADYARRIAVPQENNAGSGWIPDCGRRAQGRQKKVVTDISDSEGVASGQKEFRAPRVRLVALIASGGVEEQKETTRTKYRRPVRSSREATRHRSGIAPALGLRAGAVFHAVPQTVQRSTL
jgi:hypothetical protein